MRDDQLRRLLRERNPWWHAVATGGDPTAWAQHDPALRPAAESGIAYFPDVVADLRPPMLVLVRGPRRVGKSVAAKRYIQQLFIDGGAEQARRTIYFATDGWRAQDLRRAFTVGTELTALANGPRTWVVDEINDVDGWVAVIKELRDNTALAGDAVLLTGSSAHELTQARTALAGRTHADRPYRFLLPMTFREYLTVTGTELPDAAAPVSPDLLQSSDARAIVDSLAPLVDTLDLAWQRYLEVGGFPRAVADATTTGAVSNTFVGDLTGWLVGDVDPDAPAESVVGLLAAIEQRTASPFEVTSTAEALGTTRRRLDVRIERLVVSFGALWCRQGNGEGAPIEGGRPKLYLGDPLLAQLPHLRDPSFSPADFTRSTEAVLATELARAIDRLHPDRFVEGRAVQYTRTGSGKEVDFAPVSLRISGQQTTSVPIEGKWVSHNWRSESLVMRGRFNRGVLATKDIIDATGDVWAIPAPIVALLLN